MNLFALSGLLVSIFCLFLAVALLFLTPKKKLHIILILFNVAVAVWGLGGFLAGISSSELRAIEGWELAHLGGLFISILFYHLVCEFCNVKRPILIIFGYAQALIFNWFNWVDNSLITKTRFTYGIFYNEANHLMSFAIIAYLILVIASFRELYVYMKSADKDRKIQSRYVLFGFLIGFVGGTSTFLPEYGLDLFYPLGNLGIVLYTIIVAYAILRHQIMEIKVGISRIIIFVTILSLIVGIPLGVYYLNLFSLSGLLIAITCLGLAFLIFCYSVSKLHLIWAFFNIVVSIWGVGVLMVGRATSEESALLAWRIAFIGALFTCVLFYHTVCIFGNLKRRKFLIYAYSQGIFFAFLTLTTNWIFKNWHILFNSLYYNKAGIWYYILIINWTIVTFFAHYELFKLSKEYTGYKRIQALYLFYGSLIGFLGGVFSLLPAFGLNIYPVINFTIAIYAAVETYAILKYRLMDIRIAVTRLGIAGLVYSIVLGLPFCIGFLGRKYLENIFYHWWLVPTGICAALATVGPFIYLYFQKKAEDKILEEDLRAQNLLSQASFGMTIIHDLQHLLDLIVNIVVKTLRVEKAYIYLLDQAGQQYILKVPEHERLNAKTVHTEEPFVQYLIRHKFPVVYDELKMDTEGDAQNPLFKKVVEKMFLLQAHVAVPIVMNNALLGFLVLGERKNREMYTRGLLNALSVLGNQAALAIENCRFWEQETRRMQEESFQERIQSLDMMASSFAHEIDNPITVILGEVDLVGEMLNDARVSLPEATQETVKSSFEHIINAGKRVSGMIKAILEYSRKGTGELKPVRFADVVESFLNLIGPKFKTDKVPLATEVQESLPFVLGDKIQLEEVLINFATNSLYAVKNQPRKNVTLKIFQKDNDTIRVEFEDNGSGIPQHLLKDIFLASVTTKGSSEGTGLGLYRVRKIADLHRAQVWVESRGEGQGAKFIFEIPVYKGDIQDAIVQNMDSKLEGPNQLF